MNAPNTFRAQPDDRGHFGDYGGVPLKIIWALLDVVTIIILGSGLYLWVARRRWKSEPSLAPEPELAT